MKACSTFPSLRWWVVAWWVLALGVSRASPLVRPGMLEMVCAGAGMGTSVQLVEHTDGVVAKAAALDPHCLLCLAGSAMPTVSLPLPGAFALPAHGCCASSGAVLGPGARQRGHPLQFPS